MKPGSDRVCETRYWHTINYQFYLILSYNELNYRKDLINIVNSPMVSVKA